MFRLGPNFAWDLNFFCLKFLSDVSLGPKFRLGLNFFLSEIFYWMFRLGLNFFGLKYLSDVSLGPKFRLRPRFFFLAVLLGLLFSSLKIEKKIHMGLVSQNLEKYLVPRVKSQEFIPRSRGTELVSRVNPSPVICCSIASFQPAKVERRE